MEVKRPKGEPWIRRNSRRQFEIPLLILLPTLWPAVVCAQAATQQVGNPVAEPPEAIQEDVVVAAHRQLQQGDLEQVLKILEGPAERALPISLAEGDPLASVTAGLNRLLSQRDDEARFQLLYDWSLPGRSPNRIRHLTALVPTAAPPAEFARALGERPRAGSFPVSSIGAVRGIFSSEWSLVVAARKSGRLKRLTTELTTLVERKVPGAERLLTLARIADDRSEVSSVARRLSERIVELNDAQKSATIDAADVVLAVSALNRRELCALGEELLGVLIASAHGPPSPTVRSFLREAQATACLLAEGEPGTSDAAEVLAPQFKYWIPVGRDRNDAKSRVNRDARWLVHESQILHLCGSAEDALLLRFPLTGDFQFQFETQCDEQSETNGSLTYGGLVFLIDRSRDGLSVQELGGRVIGHRSGSVAHLADTPTFNSLSIASKANVATMSVNRHPMWVDSAGARSGPWLGMASRGEARPLFRNFRMQGNSVIPRSVRLTDDDSLRCWQAQAWGDGKTTTNRPGTDWNVSRGVLEAPRDPANRHGLEDSPSSSLAQHLLSYDRPLLSGESVNYEFFYEPGSSEVHPALGRVGFLLQPDGVRIHWMTDGDEWTSLAPGNAVVEPLSRRGPRPLPFKSSDWNRVSIARTDLGITLSLNEVVIYERPVDWTGDHRFGLYRHNTTAEVKVRNIELTGDWPTTLPPEFLENPTATVGEPLPRGQKYALNRLFQEELLAENVRAVRHKAAAMPVADRFDFLSQWVLPGDDHTGFRMTGAFTQTQPAQVAYESGVEHPEIGGQIVSPVFDWLDAARELDRLAECLKRVENAVTPDTVFQKKARIGLSLLLNLELQNQQAVAEQFEALYELLRQSNAEEQWPEMLVLDQAGRRFAANDIAAKFLADVRTLKAQQTHPPRSGLWQAQSGALLARVPSVRSGEAEAAAPSPFKDWLPVTAATAATRGAGYPVARWDRTGHSIQKRVAHDEDYLFYRSPLTGNFEIEGEILDSPQLMFGGRYFGATRDRQALVLGTFRSAAATEPVAPQFSPFWPLARFRVAVQNGTRAISINGRPVKSEKLPENSDPWLAIRCAGGLMGGVQNIRIMGHPQVLDVVPLSKSPELTGWISYHDEPVLDDTLGWTHVDDPASSGWIVAHPQPDFVGMAIESLLRYQRPLVEDGAIEYEFFYEPEKFEAHPAFDRLAFLLHPSGVREHWIGDGRHDRTALDPQNQWDVPASRRGPDKLPLKVRDWNQLRLSLRGPTVTIELNGQIVYVRNLEPTNQRTFGLFHYLGKNAVRVRNALMRGDWPKTVPRVASQELADDTVEKLDAALARLPAEFTHDFQKDGLPEEYFKAPLPGPTLRVIPGPQGVQASQRSAGPHVGFNIFSRSVLDGDFDVVAHFADLRFEGSGDAGIMLNATVADRLSREYRALRLKTMAGNQDLHASISVGPPDRGRTYIGESRCFDAMSGKLRIARHGTRMYYLFAENDSEHFFLFGSEPCSRTQTAFDGIFLHSFCNGVSISQVTWTKLVLRAERIRPPR